MAELKKSMGYAGVIALSLSALMGTGIFFGTAIGAKFAGVASLLAWLLLSVVSVYIAMIFGELVSMFPNAGGVYEFAKRTYGRFPSFLIGWVTWLVGNITASLMIVALMKYLVPILIAATGYFYPQGSGQLIPIITTHYFQIVLSIIIIIVLNYIAARGIEASSKTLIFFAVVTVTVIMTVVISAFRQFDPANLVNFLDFGYIAANSPFKTGSVLVIGFSGIYLTVFYIMEAYFGWESASFLAEETIDAKRIIPRGLLITTIICALLALLAAIATLGAIDHVTLSQQSEPFDFLARELFGDRFSILVSIGVVLTLLGCAAGGIVSAPRLLLALARDKLFIDSLAKVSEKTQTPVNAIIFQTIVTIIVVMIGFAAYKSVLSMLVPLGVIMYISVFLAVPILRYKEPGLERSFKVPFGKIGPILVSVLFLSIIIVWLLIEPGAWHTFRLLLSFIFFGIPIYLLLLFHYDPDVIVRLNDIFAYFNLAFERILIPRRIDRSILTHLGNVSGRHVLEFGCGVGTLTKELAKAVGPEGKVYATDVSYTQVKIANRRIAKRGHINVSFIHDIHQVNRVHSSVGNVDAVVSVGMLGYIQDIDKVLAEMNSLLPQDGRVFFVDYVDLFKVIPNVSWLSDHNRLREIFNKAGFAVKVETIKGKFWNYIYIYGVKSDHDVPYI